MYTPIGKKQFTNHLIVLFALVLVTIIPYQKVRHYGFVDLDDYDYLVENHHINKGFSVEGLVWAFSFQNNNDDNSYWRPLSWVSHMMDFELFGDDAGWHHLVNLVLHLSNSLLLYALLFMMTRNSLPSAMAAVLFAIHPINVESVAWITERSSVLCTSVGLMTLLLYVRYTRCPSVARYMAVFMTFLLCVMVKPILVTLPFLMLLLDYWPLGRLRFAPEGENGPRVEWRRLVIEKVPLTVLAVIAILLALHRQGSAVPTDEVAFPLRLANAVVAYVQYLFHLVYPVDLAAFYPFPKMIPLWKSCGALGVLVLISIAAVAKAGRWPFFFVGWFWYAGTLLPKIGLVQTGLWPSMADRWAYFPAIGIFVGASWLGTSCFQRQSGLYRQLIVVSSVAACMALVLFTEVHVGFWANSTRLFERMIAKTQGNYMAHNNLGTVLLSQGKRDEAKAHFLKAIQIKPDFEIPYLNLGKLAFAEGNPEKAREFYEKAVSIRPKYDSGYIALGNLSFREGHYQEAWDYYSLAVRINADDASPYNGMGGVLTKIGRLEDALAMYAKALEIDPNYKPAKENRERVLKAVQSRQNP